MPTRWYRPAADAAACRHEVREAGCAGSIQRRVGGESPSRNRDPFAYDARPLSPNPPAASKRWTWAWPLVVAALFALRAPHLSGPLDDPHSWRQCDTVHYTLDFWRNGFHLLHPKVCWLGPQPTLIFEFPLPEAMAALLDRAFGFTPLWDRIVALLFTALSVFWLHRIVREIADKTTARIATVVYLVAPLTQFYSRAPQVDFAAQAFAHGLLYHGLRSARGGGAKDAAMAAICGALAAMIKGPYLAPVLPPLLLAMAAAGSVAAAAGAAAAVAVSAVAFLLWRRYVAAVNGAAPDWNWLPGYYKEVNPWWWYVGDMKQRLAPAAWIKLAKRMINEILTPAGVLLAACASFWRGGIGYRERPLGFALAWLAGAFAYLLVFFPLNVIHNYYQVPFVAPFSLLVALGVRALTRAPSPALLRRAAWAALVALVAVALVMPAHLGWYRVDVLREQAGAEIARRVPADDLVIVVDHDSGYSDPRLLFRARHHGWAVGAEDLTPALLARLTPLGARWVAWVSEPGVARLAPPAYLADREVAAATLPGAGHGATPIGELHLFRVAADSTAVAAP